MEPTQARKFDATVEELRTRMVRKDAEFDEVVNFFMDRLGASRPFLEECEEVRNERLETILGQCAGRFLRKPALALVGGYLRHAGSDFYHGSFRAPGTMAVVLYFEKSDTGLAAFSDASLKGPTDFVRFRCVPLPEPGALRN